MFPESVTIDARSTIERQQIHALRQSYKESRHAWEKFGVVTGEELYSYVIRPRPAQMNCPEWDEIEPCLTSNILTAATQLKRPILIVIPPIPFNFAVHALDRMAPPINCWPFNMYGLKQPTVFPKYDANRHPYDDCFKLWDISPNMGYGGDSLQWRVAIVEGTKNGSLLENQGYDISGNLNLAVWALAEKGIQIVDNLQAYVSLLIVSLVKGDPIDTEGWTVLNKIRTSHSCRYDYALGHFEKDHAVFSRTFGRDADSASWHLREMIRVPLKSNR